VLNYNNDTTAVNSKHTISCAGERY